MASISLRAYQQKIENLVDRGQTEEAVAHCKHILKLFPKHVDTYRLLGKAYLEMQHFLEAGDVFQRVLSVFPDDFISQIGLSIIREDSDNLDQSIWHMERAFEIQPSNNAVQEELKRLYGKRDGIIPQKILLTRGALVRMYVRGEAYPQAIAEGIAAIQEDKQRTDIELLLAKSYLRTNQINEAFRLCLKILQTLPYAYEANQLMAEMHILTKQNDQAEPYFERIRMLDPYAAFVNENTPTSAKVDENSIVLEEFDKDTMSMDMDMEKSKESALFIDDSDRTLDFQTMTYFDSQESKSESQLESAWLDEQPGVPVQESSTMDEDDEAFLQSLTNPEEDSVSSLSEKAEVEPISVPEFLQSMTSIGASETPINDLETAVVNPEITPLTHQSDMAAESVAETDSEDLPDWLKQLEQDTKQADIELDLQKEIDSLFTEDVGNTAGAAEMFEVKHEAVGDDEQFTSMFLDDLENASQLPGKARMFSMTANLIPESDQIEAKEFDNDVGDQDVAIPAQESEIPDWLKELDHSNRLPESMNPIEDLKDESADQYAEDEALDLPDFGDPQHPVMPSTPGSLPLSEEDDAFSWLESLAAKQGAAEDSLLSDQSERSEKPPAWILQESGQTSTDFSVTAEFDADLVPDAHYEDTPESSPLTISSLEQEFPDSEYPETNMFEEISKGTAWVDEIEEPQTLLDQNQQQVGDNRVSPKVPDEVPTWLKELEEQTSDYAISADRDDQFSDPIGESENIESEENVPDWLVSPANPRNESIEPEIPEPISDDHTLEDMEFEETPLPDQHDSVFGNPPLSEDAYSPLSINTMDEEIPPQSMQEQISPSDESVKPLTPEFDHLQTFDVPDDLVEGLFQEPESVEFPGNLSQMAGESNMESDLLAQDKMDQIRALFIDQKYEQAYHLVDELIEEEYQLDEVIEELSKVIYDQPLDPGIYIRLGDAYIRNNEIQKALDMYQEAENLLQK